MFLNPDWISDSFKETPKVQKDPMEALLDDVIARNGKYMIDMVLPSQTKGHPFIPGPPFTKQFQESQKYYWVNNTTVTVMKTGEVYVSGKRVPTHEVKLIRDPRTGVISRYRVANWLDEYERKVQMLSFMNGANVSKPFNRVKQLVALIHVAYRESKWESKHGSWHSYPVGFYHQVDKTTFAQVIGTEPIYYFTRNKPQ